MIKTADWIVDLGPEGGDRGGRIIAEGTPEKVAAAAGSATGEYLARVLRGEPLVPLSDVTFAEEAGRGDRGERATATRAGRDQDRAVAQAGHRRAEAAAEPLAPVAAASIAHVPDIDFAFLADAAETIPGQKFHVLGGGIARIGGRRFPLRHPHLALVIGLQVTAPETEREHEIRFVLLDPDGGRWPAPRAASWPAASATAGTRR